MDRAEGTSQSKRETAVRAASDEPAPSDWFESEETSPVNEESAGYDSRFASWLVANSVPEASWADLLEEIPLSECQQLIVDARAISESWQALAAQLERRVQGDATSQLK
jgi:hypothetical protein